MGNRKDYQREYMKKYREENKEKLYNYEVDRQLKNAEYLKEYRKNYYSTFKKYDRYGITKQDYDLMLESQNNMCKICNIEFKTSGDVMIDHDHNTNEVRGLLCNNCNAGIGFLKDDVVLLEKAISYLKNLL